MENIMVAMRLVTWLVPIVLIFNLHAFKYDDYFQYHHTKIINEYRLDEAGFSHKYDFIFGSESPRDAANKLTAMCDESHYAALIVLSKFAKKFDTPEAQKQRRRVRAVSTDIILRSSTVSVNATDSYVAFPTLVKQIFMSEQRTEIPEAHTTTPELLSTAPEALSASSEPLATAQEAPFTIIYTEVVDAFHDAGVQSIFDSMLSNVDEEEIRCAPADAPPACVRRVADDFQQNSFDDVGAEHMAVEMAKIFSSEYLRSFPEDERDVIGNLDAEIQMADRFCDIGSLTIRSSRQYVAFTPIIQIANTLCDLVYEHGLWKNLSTDETTFTHLLRTRREDIPCVDWIVGEDGSYFKELGRTEGEITHTIFYPERFDMLGDIKYTPCPDVCLVRGDPSGVNTEENICLTAYPSSAPRILKVMPPVTLCKLGPSKSSANTGAHIGPMLLNVKRSLPFFRGYFWNARYTYEDCEIFITINTDGNLDSNNYIFDEMDQALENAFRTKELTPHDSRMKLRNNYVYRGD
ncbi:MAG: hypothetical protein LBR89_01935 [Holosporales bacterium]|jgi:hypothetical protein|nr:hypothetical protein [Holosporales bacterium]